MVWLPFLLSVWWWFLPAIESGSECQNTRLHTCTRSSLLCQSENPRFGMPRRLPRQYTFLLIGTCCLHNLQSRCIRRRNIFHCRCTCLCRKCLQTLALLLNLDKRCPCCPGGRSKCLQGHRTLLHRQQTCRTPAPLETHRRRTSGTHWYMQLLHCNSLRRACNGTR